MAIIATFLLQIKKVFSTTINVKYRFPIKICAPSLTSVSPRCYANHFNSSIFSLDYIFPIFIDFQYSISLNYNFFKILMPWIRLHRQWLQKWTKIINIIGNNHFEFIFMFLYSFNLFSRFRHHRSTSPQQNIKNHNVCLEPSSFQERWFVFYNESEKKSWKYEETEEQK